MHIQYGFEDSNNRYPLGDSAELAKDTGLFTPKIAALFEHTDIKHIPTKVTVEYEDGSQCIFERALA